MVKDVLISNILYTINTSYTLLISVMFMLSTHRTTCGVRPFLCHIIISTLLNTTSIIPLTIFLLLWGTRIWKLCRLIIHLSSRCLQMLKLSPLHHLQHAVQWHHDHAEDSAHQQGKQFSLHLWQNHKEHLTICDSCHQTDKTHGAGASWEM